MPTIEPVHDPEPLPQRPGAAPWWAALVPLSLLLLSLLGLLATVIVADRRARGAWGEISELATPAGTLVNELQTDLAREMAGRRGFLLTGTATFRQRLRAAQFREEVQLRRLAELAPRLGPEVEGRLGAVRGLVAQWRSLGPISEGQHASAAALADATAREQQLFEETLLGVSRLQQAIGAAARERRAVVRQVDRTEREVAIALIGVAILAAALYVRFARQLRSLAEREAAAAALSGRRRAELERVMADMQRMAEDKTRFIRGVTHDLKNPLSAMDAYAELLQLGVRGPLSEAQAQTVSRMRGSARAMLAIIEDLLELSRADTGQLRVSPVPTEVGPVLEDLIGAQRAVAETRGLALHLDLPDPLPPSGRTSAACGRSSTTCSPTRSSTPRAAAASPCAPPPGMPDPARRAASGSSSRWRTRARACPPRSRSTSSRSSTGSTAAVKEPASGSPSAAASPTCSAATSRSTARPARVPASVSGCRSCASRRSPPTRPDSPPRPDHAAPRRVANRRTRTVDGARPPRHLPWLCPMRSWLSAARASTTSRT